MARHPLSPANNKDTQMARTPESRPMNDLDAIREEVASLTDAVHRLVSEGAKASRTAKRSMRNAASAGEDILENVWDLGGDSAAAVSDAAKVGVSTVEKLFTRNPLGMALVALGIGFCIGLFRPK